MGLDALGAGGVDHQHVPVEDAVGGDGERGHELGLLVVEPGAGPGEDALEGGALVLADHRGERQQLVAVGPLGGHRPAVAVAVVLRDVDREAERTLGQRGVEQGPHPLQLVGGGGPAVGVLPDGEAAQRRVADQEAGVHGEAALERVEVRAEVAPRPVGPSFQGVDGHALDLGQQLAEVGRVGGVDRGQAEAAVAADDGGDAVASGRRGPAVPHELGVVVGVEVDEPGAGHQAGGVDRLEGGLVDLADGDDAAVADPDGADRGRGAGAVDDGRRGDQEIERGHGRRPYAAFVGRGGWPRPPADLSGGGRPGPASPGSAQVAPPGSRGTPAQRCSPSSGAGRPGRHARCPRR